MRPLFVPRPWRTRAGPDGADAKNGDSRTLVTTGGREGKARRGGSLSRSRRGGCPGARSAFGASVHSISFAEREQAGLTNTAGEH